MSHLIRQYTESKRRCRKRKETQCQKKVCQKQTECYRLQLSLDESTVKRLMWLISISVLAQPGCATKRRSGQQGGEWRGERGCPALADALTLCLIFLTLKIIIARVALCCQNSRCRIAMPQPDVPEHPSHVSGNGPPTVYTAGNAPTAMGSTLTPAPDVVAPRPLNGIPGYDKLCTCRRGGFGGSKLFRFLLVEERSHLSADNPLDRIMANARTLAARKIFNPPGDGLCSFHCIVECMHPCIQHKLLIIRKAIQLQRHVIEYVRSKICQNNCDQALTEYSYELGTTGNLQNIEHEIYTSHMNIRERKPLYYLSIYLTLKVNQTQRYRSSLEDEEGLGGLKCGGSLI